MEGESYQARAAQLLKFEIQGSSSLLPSLLNSTTYCLKSQETGESRYVWASQRAVDRVEWVSLPLRPWDPRGKAEAEKDIPQASFTPSPPCLPHSNLSSTKTHQFPIALC